MYYWFNNFTGNVDEAIKDALDNLQPQTDEVSNYFQESPEEEFGKIDDFKNSSKKNYDLKKMLLDPNSLNLEYSLFYLICYAIRYDKNKKTDHCSDDDFKKQIGDILYTKLNENREKIKLDLACLNFEK